MNDSIREALGRFTVICGHYGSGKTNLSINLALDLADSGESVTLVDLDIVNPYFRSADYSAMLTSRGIRVIGPTFANTNLDTPSLPAEISSVFTSDDHVIVDLGGDDAGATALGRYSSQLPEGYRMLYVVNMYRRFTETPDGAAEILREIERASRAKASGVVNNSHLKGLTTPSVIEDSMRYASEVSEILGLPLRFTTCPRTLAHGLNKVRELYPLDVHVRTPWEDSD